MPLECLCSQRTTLGPLPSYPHSDGNERDFTGHQHGLTVQLRDSKLRVRARFVSNQSLLLGSETVSSLLTGTGELFLPVCLPALYEKQMYPEVSKCLMQLKTRQACILFQEQFLQKQQLASSWRFPESYAKAIFSFLCFPFGTSIQGCEEAKGLDGPACLGESRSFWVPFPHPLRTLYETTDI